MKLKITRTIVSVRGKFEKGLEREFEKNFAEFLVRGNYATEIKTESSQNQEKTFENTTKNTRKPSARKRKKPTTTSSTNSTTNQ